jgi:aryl-alcohol dehydrogenase-like predicted oxidoreductase
MEYRQLGSSGLRISTLTMGTMTFGGGDGGFRPIGATDLQAARRQLGLCRDHGVNLIDTADMYSAGESEEIIGAALAGQRDDWLVATKVRFPTGDGPNDAGLSRHHILTGAEASLRRLRTDHIDLYQVHEWDGRTRLEETLSALDTLVQQGKVRYTGVSNYTGWQLMKALALAGAAHLTRFASQQIYYSLQSRDAEFDLLPVAADQGLGVLVWSPLAGGLLTGKYSRGADGQLQGPSGARQMSTWDEPPIDHPDRLFATLDVLAKVAGDRGVSCAQVALAWLLAQPTITSLVIGARTDEQLTDNLAAAGLTLTGEEIRQLERVSRPPLPYPHWHQFAGDADRFGPADQVAFGPRLED